MTRRSSSYDREAAAEARAERLSAATQKLVDAVGQMGQEWDWRKLLKFHTSLMGTGSKYSLTNSFLIWAQNPDSTMVGPYTKWKSIGRQVRRGEKGMTIFTPTIIKVTDGTELPRDMVDAEGNRRRLVGFGTAKVFDISQTEGEPVKLPAGTAQLRLDGAAPQDAVLAAEKVVADCGFSLAYQDEPIMGNEGILGLTNYRDRTVLVLSNRSAADQFATLLHELGHVRAHDPNRADDLDPFRQHRGAREVEAEAIAFLVADHFGVDTSKISVSYIASWARGNAAEVVESLGTINAQTKWIIDKMTGHLDNAHTDPALDLSANLHLEPAAVGATQQIGI